MSGTAADTGTAAVWVAGTAAGTARGASTDKASAAGKVAVSGVFLDTSMAVWVLAADKASGAGTAAAWDMAASAHSRAVSYPCPMAGIPAIPACSTDIFPAAFACRTDGSRKAYVASRFPLLI
ncbi:MAG: hypothetical protein RR301_11505 [Clostridia bacterium]